MLAKYDTYTLNIQLDLYVKCSNLNVWSAQIQEIDNDLIGKLSYFNVILTTRCIQLIVAI